MEWVRPKHIAFIKAADINYQDNLIRITAAGSKNKKIKYKQLMPDLKKLLIEYEYHKLPGNFYLFGTNNFEPSAKFLKSISKRSSEVWRKIVIDGLGINKKMYALKHTSGQYYINANKTVDAGFLQHHMEHHSLSETETYIAKRSLKKIDTNTVNWIEY